MSLPVRIAALCALWTVALTGRDGVAAGASWQRGVALGLFAEDSGWSYAPLLVEIARAGADHVELVVSWYQDDGRATRLYDHPRLSAPLDAVRAAVRAAHTLGLGVTLFPIIRLASPQAGEWRGTLAPGDRDAWFVSYGARLEQLARLAAAEHVEALCVGSELSTLDGDLDHWRPLIARVRRLFRGRLVYSANWDHFDAAALYKLVDVAGVSGYFPLAEELDAQDRAVPIEELEVRWLAARSRLEEVARKIERPMLFTEIGYLSQRGASAWPWREEATGPVDLDEQRRCYAAFARAFADAPAFLAGVYFWNWYGWGGPASRGYTPRGKPAERELRDFFQRLAR